MKLLLQRLQKYQVTKPLQVEPRVEGVLTRSVGMTLEAQGFSASIGDQCVIDLVTHRVEAEVVGFADDKIYLMPVAGIAGIQPGAKVYLQDSRRRLILSDACLGRIFNGLSEPLDGGERLLQGDAIALTAETINPLDRDPINEPLDVGIQAINGLLSVGRGQRLGLFAGSGVGKSVLLGMMTKYTSADIVVVGLIGERGREVKEFIEQVLGEEGLRRAVVIASPADEVPLMRLRAAQLATRTAEYFRDRGKNVLLLMDSLTRYAQAQREVALATGEPPATKGYPPSVFAKIPQLVERAGNGRKGGGSITAFYTVLTEGDDLQDPIADASRAILDGHIVLSRQLADEGIYPAIDVEKSISRVMPNIVSEQHLRNSQRFKQLLALYRQNKDLISVGAYAKGADADVDAAIDSIADLRNYIRQPLSSAVNYQQAGQLLKKLVEATWTSAPDLPSKAQ